MSLKYLYLQLYYRTQKNYTLAEKSIINILPSHVANQIAAGEVVQRPSSVVKELLENSIDAKATHIKLIVEDGGKTLIQVIDNGQGMSEKDAKLCFLRHATSKILSAEDLFKIHTKGFRGEALASIAAVAQVKLTTRLEEDELASKISIEGSEFVGDTQKTNASRGTNIEVRNLFFNIPARRAFLKSDAQEINKINEEFEKVALAHPEVKFEMIRNGNLIYSLTQSNLRRRIVSLFKGNTDNKLIPIEEKTSVVDFSGFIFKPEFAKQKSPDQFLFVNNRFIKNSYLNHAINSAYQGIIPEKYYPSFFIFFYINPNLIDINIHPTKTEISFSDEKTIYTFLKSSVRAALGHYNINTSIDFDQNQDINKILDYPNVNVAPPKILFDPNYNPFKEPSKSSYGKISKHFNSSSIKPIDFASNITDEFSSENKNEDDLLLISSDIFESVKKSETYNSVFRRFIISHNQEDIILIDPKRAIQRINYECFLKQIDNRQAESQQLLFPLQIEFDRQDLELFNNIAENFELMGFRIESSGENAINVLGVPQQINESLAEDFIKGTIADFKENKPIENQIPHIIAEKLSLKIKSKDISELTQIEIDSIVNNLLLCKEPALSPSGKRCILNLDDKEIENKFK